MQEQLKHAAPRSPLEGSPSMYKVTGSIPSTKKKLFSGEHKTGREFWGDICPVTSSCRPGWPLTEIRLPDSRVLGLKAYATMAQLCFLFLFFSKKGFLCAALAVLEFAM